MLKTGRFSGRLASSYLSRGGIPGYELYLSEERVVGINRRRIPFLITLTLLAIVIASGFVAITLVPSSLMIVLILLFLLTFVRFPQVSKLTDEWLKRHPAQSNESIHEKADFELAKDQIQEIMISKWQPGQFLGTKFGVGKGYILIFPANPGAKPIRIEILGLNQYNEVANLMEAFCSLSPPVPYLKARF